MSDHRQKIKYANSMSMESKTFNLFSDYLYPRYIKDPRYFPILIVTAIIASHLKLTTFVGIAVIVNLFATISGYLINDIEDREDDVNSPGKRFINPFGYKIWNTLSGYVSLISIGLATLILSYFFNGLMPGLIILSNLLIGYLYSWKNLRLKSMPIIDILSHTYFLGVSTMIYFVFLPNAAWNLKTTLLILTVFFASAHSDLDNEYRDFDDDEKAGIRNSASYLGKKATLVLTRLSLSAAVVMGILGILI